MATANLTFTNEGQLTGLRIASFGDNVLLYNAQQYHLASLSQMLGIENAVKYVTSKTLGSRSIKDYYLYHLEILNLEKPIIDPRYRNGGEETYPFFFLRIDDKFKASALSGMYKNVSLEELSDTLYAVSLLPDMYYPISSVEDRYIPILSRRVTFPKADVLGERDPDAIATRVERLDVKNDIANNLGDFSRAKKPIALPGWANPGEIVDDFRVISSILLPLEQEMIALEEVMIPIMTQDYNQLQHQLTLMSQNNMPINVFTTMKKFDTDENLFPSDKKLPILTMPQRIDLLAEALPFVADLVDQNATAKTGTSDILYATTANEIVFNVMIRLASGTRETVNSRMNSRNINRINCQEFQTKLRWALFNPKYNKIIFAAIKEFDPSTAVIITMMMLLLPSALFPPEHLIELNNVLYTNLWTMNVLNRVGLRDPNTIANLHDDLLMDLVRLIAVQPPEVQTLIRTIYETRAALPVGSYAVWCNGLPQDQITQGPELYRGAAPYAICFPFNLVQGKALAITALMAAWRGLSTIRGRMYESIELEKFTFVLELYATNIVNGIRDCGRAVSLPSSRSVYSNLAGIVPFAAYNKRSMTLRVALGLILSNDTDVYPLHPTGTDATEAYDSLILILRASEDIMNKVPISDWDVVVDNMTRVYSSKVAIDTSLLFVLKNGSLRTRLRAIQIRYRLPPFYQDFLNRLQLVTNIVKQIKPIIGMADVVYITKVKGQMLYQYRSSEMVSSLSTNQLNILGSLTYDQYIKAYETPEMNDRVNKFITIKRSQLDALLTKLQDAPVPTIEDQLLGARIPVIRLFMRSMVTSHRHVVTRLDDIKTPALFSKEDIYLRVCKKDEYINVDEHVYYLNNRRELDRYEIDRALYNGSSTFYLLSERDASRSDEVTLAELRQSVADVTTRKRPYETFNEVTIDITLPTFGQSLPF